MRSATTAYDVRWRRTGANESWSAPQRFPAGKSIEIDGLDREQGYDFQLRAVGSCGSVSDWVNATHVVASANLPPVAVDTISAVSLADGVHLAWTVDGIQPAHVEYSVERAPDVSGSPGTFAEITKVRGLAYTDAVTDGVVRWYRVRAVDYNGNFGGYSPSVNSRGKVVADGADNSAITVGPKILNPNFAGGDVYWVKETGWSITGGNAVRAGNAGSPNAAIYNSALVPVKPSQQVMVQCLLTASGADGWCASALRWFDGNQAYISQTPGNSVTGNAGNTLSRITAAAPANAAYVSAAAIATSNTAGTYTASYFQMTLFPNNQDEIPDSATRGATSTTYLNANRPIINFGDTFHQNKNVDNIADGAVYGRTSLSRLNAGRPVIDFSETIHANKSQDNIPDGSTRGATSTTYLNANRPIINFGDTFHQNKNLDYVGDGTTFSRVRSGQVVDGVVQLLGSGRNAIQNPSFTQNVGGFPNSQPTLYSYIRDGWQLLSKTDTAIYPLYDPGGPGIGFIFQSGIAIAAGGSSQGSWYSAPFAVQPNATFALRLYRQIYLAQALQAGLVAVSSAAIDFYDASGAYLSTGPYYEKTGAFSNAYDVHTGTVPANARTARLQLFGILRNTSGATITTAYGNTAEPLFVSVEFVQAADLDNDVVDGSTYARIKGTELSSGVHKLTVAGSGTRIGDQRNVPQIATANQRSKWSGQTISYSATAGTPATATISVTASTLLIGSVSVAYNAMSVGVSGTGGNTVTYYLYCDDAGYAGGARTLVATTNGNDLYGADGRVYVGSCAVTFPSSGSGSGGGTGGGGSCVVLGSHSPYGVIDIHTSTVCTPSGAARVRTLRVSPQKCVRVRCDNGSEIECSEDAPLMRGQARVLAADSLGAVLDTTAGPSKVAGVESIGIRDVAEIDAGNVAFYAGVRASGPFVLHHNKLVP